MPFYIYSTGPVLPDHYIESRTGKLAVFELEDGLSGIYQGTVELGDKRYGMIETSQTCLSMVPYDHCVRLTAGKTAVIREHFDTDKEKTVYFAKQPEREIKRGDKEINMNPRHKTKDIEMELEL